MPPKNSDTQTYDQEALQYPNRPRHRSKNFLGLGYRIACNLIGESATV